MIKRSEHVCYMVGEAVYHLIEAEMLTNLTKQKHKSRSCPTCQIYNIKSIKHSYCSFCGRTLDDPEHIIYRDLEDTQTEVIPKTHKAPLDTDFD